jgi:hypothetical protein
VSEVGFVGDNIDAHILQIQVIVFWVMTPCSNVVGYQHFRGHAASMIQEHCRHIRLYHPEKSATSINLDHCIQSHDTSILVKKSRHMEHIISEAIEIELNPDNMNREEGIFLNMS